MELSPAQRKLVFAVLVFILAGLGAFLLWPASPPARGQAVYGNAPTARPSSPPVAAPTAPVPAQSGSAVNIYQWLPFTQSDLTAAAGVVRQFCADYATYSYTQSAASYVGKMRSLITPSLAATLSRGFATPGVARVRIGEKQTAAGSGVITALRAFGPSSLTFLVTVSQKTYSTQRGKTTASVTSSDYAVTVAQTGSGWQVNDIQLASAGNS